MGSCFQNFLLPLVLAALIGSPGALPAQAEVTRKTLDQVKLGAGNQIKIRSYFVRFALVYPDVPPAFRVHAAGLGGAVFPSYQLITSARDRLGLGKEVPLIERGPMTATQAASALRSHMVRINGEGDDASRKLFVGYAARLLLELEPDDRVSQDILASLSPAIEAQVMDWSLLFPKGLEGVGAVPSQPSQAVLGSGGKSGTTTRTIADAPIRERASWDEIQPVEGLELEPGLSQFRDKVTASGAIYEQKKHELARGYARLLMELKAQLVARRVHGPAEAVQAEVTRLAAKDYSGFPSEAQLPDKVRDLRSMFDEYSNKLVVQVNQADVRALLEYDQLLSERASAMKDSGDLAGLESLQNFRASLFPSEPVPDPSTAVAALGTPQDPEAAASKPRAPAGPSSSPTTPGRHQAALDRLAHFMPRGLSDEEMQKHAAVLGPKPPEQDDTYPLLIESMNSGQVTEVTPAKIKLWGVAEAEMINADPYWTIPVFYDVRTMFGSMETEAKALVQNGKVVRWIYSGSLEEVP